MRDSSARGRPGPGDRDAVLADAVRRGWLTPPLSRQRPMPRHPIAPLEDVLRDLAADRDGR